METNNPFHPPPTYPSDRAANMYSDIVVKMVLSLRQINEVLLKLGDESIVVELTIKEHMLITPGRLVSGFPNRCTPDG